MQCICGNSSVGRASASQAEGREFESRLPLFTKIRLSKKPFDGFFSIHFRFNMYLFNPDTDLALAHSHPHYTPPASALDMARDLALLPIWYAPEGESIILERTDIQSFIQKVQQYFTVEPAFVPFSELPVHREEQIIPWGWNLALRKKLIEAGVAESRLPSAADIERLKMYSDRQYAVKMLRELKAVNPLFYGQSDYFTHPEEAFTYLSMQKSDSVLKKPNSGSGKGLVWIKGKITDKQMDWCRRVIRQQGGVVVEPVLDKVLDFAFEYRMSGGDASFAGYSLFRTTASGAYEGNYLLADEKIETVLAAYAPLEDFLILRALLTRKLAEYFPRYNGYIGVDMMICRTCHGFRIQPCVEINMRMNMGVLARGFYDRFLQKNASGVFKIDYFKRPGDALAHAGELERKYPLRVERRKIVSGCLPMTPVTEETKYMAYALIFQEYESLIPSHSMSPF